jgi:hypothetical protein
MLDTVDREEIISKIRTGKSRSTIIKELQITDHTFQEFCRERFGTPKITEAKNILMKEDLKKELISEQSK